MAKDSADTLNRLLAQVVQHLNTSDKEELFARMLDAHNGAVQTHLEQITGKQTSVYTVCVSKKGSERMFMAHGGSSDTEQLDVFALLLERAGWEVRDPSGERQTRWADAQESEASPSVKQRSPGTGWQRD